MINALIISCENILIQYLPKCENEFKLLRDLTQGGISSLLTTHSMSECEALCTRIGIMKEGRLQCIGSSQQLKSKYGQGYVMKFYLLPSQEHVPLLREVERRLPNSRLKSQHLSLLDFSLEGNFKLSDTLSHIFQLRREFHIQEFSSVQTTLDDVFLRIVSERRLLSLVRVSCLPMLRVSELSL